jgi:predicted DNA binding protein
MKKTRVKDAFLEQLRKIPIVAVAAEKVGVSRNSVYKWRNADEAFRDAMETALAEGEALVNDMGESQLLSLIQEKNWSAISFWLRHRNPKFRERIEVSASIKQVTEKLTPEQESVVREALRLAALSGPDVSPQTDHGPDSTGPSPDPADSQRPQD